MLFNIHTPMTLRQTSFTLPRQGRGHVTERIWLRLRLRPNSPSGNLRYARSVRRKTFKNARQKKGVDKRKGV